MLVQTHQLLAAADAAPVSEARVDRVAWEDTVAVSCNGPDAPFGVLGALRVGGPSTWKPHAVRAGMAMGMGVRGGGKFIRLLSIHCVRIQPAPSTLRTDHGRRKRAGNGRGGLSAGVIGTIQELIAVFPIHGIGIQATP